MNFEQAFEYASGSVKAEELKTNSQEFNDQTSTVSTAASQRNSTEGARQGELKRTICGFGKFQVLALAMMTMGMTSGSYIILPLSYLELMP